MFLFSHTELFLLGTIVFLFMVLTLYYLIVYAKPLFSKTTDTTPHAPTPPISVILYAKNDAENLKKHLPTILKQNYPTFQVIVVNDGSNDDTEDVLKIFQNQYKNLYYTYIPSDARYMSRRKLALTLGAKAAKYELLLFTETNCQPISEHWLTSIAESYTPETNIILGFCRYPNHKGFSHKMIAYDNLLSGLRYLAAALLHHPYTGNGRNLSYRKDLFFKHKGYYKSLNLHAGDDDLFVNEATDNKNTKAIFIKDSLTEMDPVLRFNSWKAIKASRAMTQSLYKGSMPILFHIESYCFFLFQVVSAISMYLALTTNNYLLFVIVLLLYLTRFIIKAIVFNKSAKMLQQKPNVGWLLLLEFIHPLFNCYIKIYHFFRRKKDYTFSLER